MCLSKVWRRRSDSSYIGGHVMSDYFHQIRAFHADRHECSALLESRLGLNTWHVDYCHFNNTWHIMAQCLATTQYPQRL